MPNDSNFVEEVKELESRLVEEAIERGVGRHIKNLVISLVLLLLAMCIVVLFLLPTVLAGLAAGTAMSALAGEAGANLGALAAAFMSLGRTYHSWNNISIGRQFGELYNKYRGPPPDPELPALKQAIFTWHSGS